MGRKQHLATLTFSLSNCPLVGATTKATAQLEGAEAKV